MTHEELERRVRALEAENDLLWRLVVLFQSLHPMQFKQMRDRALHIINKAERKFQEIKNNV